MKEKDISTWSLLNWFTLEEWRLHTELFGKNRFILFPFIIFAFSFGLGAALPLLSIQQSTLLLAFHLLIVLFGVQTGVVGFDAQDALENVLGETAMLIFSSRTLPVSQERLAGIFLLKDALYYTGLFLVPVVSGGVIGLSLSPLDSTILVTGISSVLTVSIYLTTILAFVFGVSFGFMLTTINYKNKDSIGLVGLLFVVLVGAIQLNIVSLNRVTVTNPNSLVVLTTLASVVFITIGLYNFEGTQRSYSQQRKNLYSKTVNSLNVTDTRSLLAVKYFVDIRRSAGGFWKVVFSSFVIAFSGYVLVAGLAEFYTIRPNSGFLFGSITALIAFSIYTVIFRYDSIETYLKLPVSKKTVYESKIFTYLLLSISIGIAYYTPTIFTYGSAQLSEYIQGLAILLSMLCYQLGLLLILVKDDPTGFLFDGVLFSTFSGLVMALLVPALIIGLFGLLFSQISTYAVLLFVVIASIASVLVASRKLEEI